MRARDTSSFALDLQEVSVMADSAFLAAMMVPPRFVPRERLNGTVGPPAGSRHEAQSRQTGPRQSARIQFVWLSDWLSAGANWVDASSLSL